MTYLEKLNQAPDTNTLKGLDYLPLTLIERVLFACKEVQNNLHRHKNQSICTSVSMYVDYDEYGIDSVLSIVFSSFGLCRYYPLGQRAYHQCKAYHTFWDNEQGELRRRLLANVINTLESYIASRGID